MSLLKDMKDDDCLWNIVFVDNYDLKKQKNHISWPIYA